MNDTCRLRPKSLFQTQMEIIDSHWWPCLSWLDHVFYRISVLFLKNVSAEDFHTGHSATDTCHIREVLDIHVPLWKFVGLLTRAFCSTVPPDITHFLQNKTALLHLRWTETWTVSFRAEIVWDFLVQLLSPPLTLFALLVLHYRQINTATHSKWGMLLRERE